MSLNFNKLMHHNHVFGLNYHKHIYLWFEFICSMDEGSCSSSMWGFIHFNIPHLSFLWNAKKYVPFCVFTSFCAQPSMALDVCHGVFHCFVLGIENLKVAGVWQGVFKGFKYKERNKKRAPITSMGCKVQLPC